MGKRSNFERVEKDYYRTFDPKAVAPLVKYLPEDVSFIEPFAGDGSLILNIQKHLPKSKCVWSSDVDPKAEWISPYDYEDVPYDENSYVVSNPPWNRKILHEVIDFYHDLWEERNVTTWLLWDANWLWTKQAKPFFNKIEYVIPIGRVKWIEDSNMSSKDDCAWFKIGGYESEIRIVS